MKYKHTSRSAIAYLLLSIPTLFIYNAVVSEHIRKEYLALAEGKSAKRPSSYIFIYFLGLLTLGIVPLVWHIKMAGRIGALAKEKGLARPKTSSASFALWTLLGLLILVGPFIGRHQYLHTLNVIERDENEKAEHPLALPAPEEEVALLPEPPLNATSPENEEVVNFGASFTQGEDPLPTEAPVEPAPSQPVPVLEEDPLQKLLQAYADCPEGKYKVRFEHNEAPIRSFRSKDDAFAFSKELASLRGVKARYRGKGKSA